MKSRSILAALGCVTLCHGAPAIKGVENHWVANSGSNQNEHIQNFIEDMTVKPDGSVLTQSFYDEAQQPNSTYRNGKWVDKNWSMDASNPHPSRRATFGGVTWNIVNFWGRGFVGKLAKPSADSLPYIESSDGRKITSLVDPTAIAFDKQGRLLVGENGPDQNIKIFDVASVPKIVGTFGESLGVYAGPVRGVVGPKRFWGIRGIGVDSSGKVYVGCTGMPMQVGGGTHIRAFSGMGAKDSLLWQVMGLAFVNTVDADPDSGGASLHKNHTRFHMDWTKPPGSSWSFAAVTSDPFKYPDDPRFVHSFESVWFRRIQGKRFLFLTDMNTNYLAIMRFEENSEIAIPTAFLPIGNPYRDSSSGLWALNRRPIWGAATGTDYRRWMWRDDNGDGQAQSNEFHTFNLVYPSTHGIDIDDSGTIWWGGNPYMVEFRPGVLDSKGVPKYNPDSLKTWKVPFKSNTANNGYVMFCRYLASKDAMIVTSGVREGLISQVYRYDNWKSKRRAFLGWNSPFLPNDTLVPTWIINAPYKPPADWSQWLNLSVADTCWFSNNLAADTDYVYLGYVDKGPYGHRNGEVALLNVRTGAPVGWIAPGPETGFMSGWFDLWHGINAYTRPNGEKILMTEEDYSGKVNVYRWCPKASCVAPDTTRKDTLTSAGRVRYATGHFQINVDANSSWELSAFTLDGRRVAEVSGRGPSYWVPPVRKTFLVTTLRSDSHSESHSFLVP